jgi:multidrug efflux pump subunit AcrB
MHGLAKLCIKRPVFATMLMLAFIVSGIFTYSSLGVDRMPKIDAPFVMVTVVNPGASPEEVETEITKKIEDAVNSISGLNEISSTSSEGMALIRIEFDLLRKCRTKSTRLSMSCHRALRSRLLRRWIRMLRRFYRSPSLRPVPPVM